LTVVSGAEPVFTMPVQDMLALSGECGKLNGPGFCGWSGRTIIRRRAEIRADVGFREGTVADADDLAGWPPATREGCPEQPGCRSRGRVKVACAVKTRAVAPAPGRLG
jgi:hypothetical protein